VLNDFLSECLIQGFRLQDIYKVKTVPRKEPKRFVLVHKKGWVTTPQEHVYCMLNSDGTRSEWYLNLMRDFHSIK
jgi:tRNA1Val (adenine37-N6)-methyltransferase